MLGILAVLMNNTADSVMDAALSSQRKWQEGRITRFDLVEDFLEGLVPGQHDRGEDQLLSQALSRIRVLVTTGKNGVEILRASDREELLDLSIKTTFVPALTGWGFLLDEQDVYLDGGFSRFLHPECEHQLELPVVWETLVHTFTPSLSRETIQELWNAGYEYEYENLDKGEPIRTENPRTELQNETRPVYNSDVGTSRLPTSAY